MNEFKIYFNFDAENRVTQIVTAETREQALNNIPDTGYIEFEDVRRRLVRISMEKVTHIEVIGPVR
ncbi:hypothetical protein QUF49_03825 [Fictibacillus sp. b24]|uniref:hypothetical protein n=1 Tax=Fictibacillus sp. b24 TaxID=3055863 RepID=UPI0025A033C3|nr:hypothetical protein [Fictibacillus sp. b24]MDM5315110.1 hypothetical protein [Fictibacillus sp. b24]